MRPLIVSRHAGAIQWLRETFPQLVHAEVLEQVTPAQVEGRVVVGNLPLYLAARCGEYYALEFTGSPPRGTEYGPDEMRAAGAHLARYIVLHRSGGWLTQS